jgi:hypothetical protein
VDGPAEVHLRLAVVVAHSRLGKGAEHVQLRHGLGGGEHPVHLPGGPGQQGAEHAVFQLVHPVPGGEEIVFQLLELRSEIALVGH